ncbi:MAG: ABC transporter permease [Anaerolineae bacterium]|jgi:ABC-2 type transport system permease protein
MRKIWQVIKHDVGVTFRQWSFWILTLLMPVFLILVNAYYIVQESDLGSATSNESTEGTNTSDAGLVTAVGLVDKAGIITEIPPDLPSGAFIPFSDEASARSALEDGEIAQYVRIPADYVSTGQVTVYDQDFHILQSGRDMGVAFGSENQWMLPYLIDYNLVSDRQVLAALGNPVPGNRAEYHALRPPAESTGAERQDLAEVVASAMPYLFYFLLVMGSQYLMRSVVAEKENRTVEVLLLSLDPREMMAGKLAAMSLVTLVQVGVWVGGGLLILNKGAELLSVAQYDFPPGFLVWATLFLILGFLLFASIMAAIGAISPNAREAGQTIWILILPLMPTLMFARLFLEEPDGTFAVVMSLFPLSAPSAMVTRLAVAPVPLWQTLASLAGLALTTYLFLMVAARFFRPGNLLSSEAFNWRRLVTGWRT